MPGLRGHHLICLHFFGGEGYSAPFVENLKEILARAEGSIVETCEGGDDVCLKCPHLKGNRCIYSDDADGNIRNMDRRALNLLNLDPGIKIGWNYIKVRLPGIFHEWYKAECIRCSWRWACEKNSLYQQMVLAVDDNA